MSSTLETLRAYEANAEADRNVALARGDTRYANYCNGKADAYGVAIDMLEGDERREDVAAGKRFTR